MTESADYVPRISKVFIRYKPRSLGSLSLNRPPNAAFASSRCVPAVYHGGHEVPLLSRRQ
jgi:hypothetical protein